MRLPRWLFIIVSVVAILYWSQKLWKSNSEPSLFDLPKTLEETSYTITVYPVSNVNNVLVFTTGKGGLEKDYLYLVPAADSIDFPGDYHAKKDSGYSLQVHGRFYQGKGIPAAYLQVNPKPRRLRIFQFNKAEFVFEKKEL